MHQDCAVAHAAFETPYQVDCPAAGGTGSPCDKCNISPCRGGCKCDSSCSCRPTWGGSPCDKCNIPQDQGGCKCDSNCNCLAGTCWA